MSMHIGITGHQELTDPAWVTEEISNLLKHESHSLVGVTSLAVGADQIFAQAVLDIGGDLQVIVPFDEYANVFKAEGREKYSYLLARAAIIEVLSMTGSHEEAYFAAGKRVVDTSDLVIAVWNGRPAAGLGGTADVVEYARLQKKRLVHINPTTKMTVE